MSTNKLSIGSVLHTDELARIDAFCAEHREEESLPELATFLSEQFGVETPCAKQRDQSRV